MFDDVCMLKTNCVKRIDGYYCLLLRQQLHSHRLQLHTCTQSRSRSPAWPMSHTLLIAAAKWLGKQPDFKPRSKLRQIQWETESVKSGFIDLTRFLSQKSESGVVQCFFFKFTALFIFFRSQVWLNVQSTLASCQLTLSASIWNEMPHAEVENRKWIISEKQRGSNMELQGGWKACVGRWSLCIAALCCALYS